MSPYQFTLVPSYPGTYEMIRRLYAVLGPLSRIGLGPVLADATADLPATSASPARTPSRSAHDNYDNARDEVSLYRQSLEQAQALTSLGAKPLVVVTTTESIRSTPAGRPPRTSSRPCRPTSSHRIVDTTHVGLLVDRDRVGRLGPSHHRRRPRRP